MKKKTIQPAPTKPPFLGAEKLLLDGVRTGKINQVKVLLRNFAFSKENKMACVPFLMKPPFEKILDEFLSDPDVFRSVGIKMAIKGEREKILMLLPHAPAIPSSVALDLSSECLKHVENPSLLVEKLLPHLSKTDLQTVFKLALQSSKISLASTIKNTYLQAPLPCKLLPLLQKHKQTQWFTETVLADPYLAFRVNAASKSYMVCLDIAPHMDLDRLKEIYDKSPLKKKDQQLGAFIEKRILERELHHQSQPRASTKKF
jgi:hypothetical protein